MWQWYKKYYCFLVEDVGCDLTSGEGPHGIPSTGNPEDDGHGTQTPTEWDMGISTHRGGAGDGRTIIYRGVYLPQP